MSTARVMSWKGIGVAAVLVGAGAGGLTWHALMAQQPDAGAENVPSAPQLVQRAGMDPSFAPRQLEMAQTELLQVISELRKTRVEISFRERKQESTLIPQSAIEAAIKQDPKMKDLSQEIASTKESLKACVAARAGRVDSWSEPLRETLKSLEKELADRRENLLPKTTLALQRKGELEFKADMAPLYDRVALLKEMEQVLRKEVVQLQKDVGSRMQTIEERVGSLEKELAELRKELRKGKR